MATFGTNIDRAQATMEFQPDGAQDDYKDATKFCLLLFINHENV